MEPGTDLTLTWHVHNADDVRIRRASPDGPPADAVNPAGNTLYLGPFNGTRPADATYELAAGNVCGETVKTVTVRLRKTPALKIVGIEVIQAIQRFNLANPAHNNSVPLVQYKRTMARVYVESGITGGFDSGAGPNVQPDVIGELKIFGESSTFPSGGVVTTPLSPGGVVEARPVSQINRAQLTHTLNFEPDYAWLSGNVRLEARAWVNGHEDAAGWSDSQSVTVNFAWRRKQRLVRILVGVHIPLGNNEFLTRPAPTEADFFTSLDAAVARFPVEQWGFIVEIVPGFETITTKHDLRNFKGWTDLLKDITDIADDAGLPDRIWAALVSREVQFSPGGMFKGGRDETRRFAAEATLPATFAHEMAHVFGAFHAPCPRQGEQGAPDPLSVDDYHPTQTEDIGMNVAERFLIPANTSELMSYCTPFWPGAVRPATFQDRWPSIALWEILFDAFS